MLSSIGRWRYSSGMRRICSALLTPLLLVGCAASEDSTSQTKAPIVDKPVLAPAASTDAAPVATGSNATPSIASVQLIQDCPDPKKELAKSDMALDEPTSKRKAKRAPGAGPLRQPCTQSTLQMAFVGQGSTSARVKLGEIRLLTKGGQSLGTLAHRAPSLWKSSGYEAWDELLAANADSQASYKLSLPDWAAVEAAIGSSSYGQMYVVEVDVDIDGTITTVTSPEFERGRPQIIKT